MPWAIARGPVPLPLRLTPGLHANIVNYTMSCHSSLFLFHCQGTQRRRQVAPSQTSVTAENMQDFIFDPNEAYAYYLNFVKVSINVVYCLHIPNGCVYF